MRILKAYAWRDFGWMETCVLLRELSTGEGGKTISSYGQPVVMKAGTPEEEGVNRVPTLRLEDGAAQMLMDQLWNVGFRPTEGTGSAGSLAATQAHLNDMRRLVAHTLKLKEKF